MRRALTILGTAAILLLPATSATAGGWWSSIDLQTGYMASGHEVKARTEFLFDSIPEAERARRSGGFYAYLIRSFDWSTVEDAMRTGHPGDWWRLGPADAIRVGRVRFSGWDANLATARTRFTVPSIPGGTYAFMFCDVGCRNPLGDIVPSQVRVVSEPAIVDLSIQDARFGTQLYRLERLAREATRSADRAGSLAEDVRALQMDAADLRGRLLSAEREGADPEPIPWFAFAGWFLAGIAVSALVVVLGRRRRRSRRGPPPVAVPDDARELVGSSR